MEWNGVREVVLCGVALSGVEWSGVGSSRPESPRAGCGVEWSGGVSNVLEWNGVKWEGSDYRWGSNHYIWEVLKFTKRGSDYRWEVLDIVKLGSQKRWVCGNSQKRSSKDQAK